MGDFNIPLHRRHQLHLARKLWHSSGVGAILWVYLALSPEWRSPMAVAFWVFVVLADFIRLKNPQLNRLVLQVMKPFMREHERHQLAGTTSLATGVAIVILVFPWHVVLLSLLFLALADPIASGFGILYGKDKLFGHKSLQGSLAAFGVSACLGAAFFLWAEEPWARVFLFSFLAGAIGSISELVPIGDLDDNLTMPLISASALQVCFWLLQFSPEVSL